MSVYFAARPPPFECGTKASKRPVRFPWCSYTSGEKCRDMRDTCPASDRVCVQTRTLASFYSRFLCRKGESCRALQHFRRLVRAVHAYRVHVTDLTTGLNCRQYGGGAF